MICAGCSSVASHIISEEGREYCEHCSTLSVVSKSKTDGLLTRNSWRVRRQQSRFEGDIIRPHTYDKNAKRERVNPDFLKLYPDKVKEYFSADELKRDGYKQMPERIEKNRKRTEKLKAQYKKDTIYSGSSKKAIGNFLQATK